MVLLDIGVMSEGRFVCLCFGVEVMVLFLCCFVVVVVQQIRQWNVGPWGSG